MMTRRRFLSGAAEGAAGATVMPGLMPAAQAAGPKWRIRVSSCSAEGIESFLRIFSLGPSDFYDLES